MYKKILASLVIGVSFILFGYMLTTVQHEFPLKVYPNQLNESAKKEVECLANNIFFEAAYEPKSGQVAVAFVTLNRMNSGFFPRSICEVVKQKTTTVCQFSWYCEEKPKRLSYSKDLTPSQQVVYNAVQNLAMYVYANYSKMDDPTNGALFYHADYVSPKWKNMVHTATIGRHIFYIRKDML